MTTITSQSGTVHLVDNRAGRFPFRIRTACDMNIRAELDGDQKGVTCCYCAAYLEHSDALKLAMDRMMVDRKRLLVSSLADEIGVPNKIVEDAAMCMEAVSWERGTNHTAFMMQTGR